MDKGASLSGSELYFVSDARQTCTNENLVKFRRKQDRTVIIILINIINNIHLNGMRCDILKSQFVCARL